MHSRQEWHTYIRYIVPSMASFVLTGVYSIVDGLFVGHAVGDAGLAGINVAWPLVAFMMAVGTGIGMGGAVISSVYAGIGDTRSSQRAIAHTLMMLTLAAPLIMLVLFGAGKPLLYVMGGRGDILIQSESYLSVMAFGSIFQILASGCIPLLRNKGRVMLAMTIIIASGLMNVVLDFLLVMVWGYGVVGAALATLISQAFVFVAVMVFFMRKENRPQWHDFSPDRSFVFRTLKGGFAPFALTLLPEVTTLVMNIATEAHGGAYAQAAFAVISYVGVSVQWVIQGVNDGSQPLVSVAFGEGNLTRMHTLRKANYLICIIIGAVGMALLIGFRIALAQLFNISEASSEVFYQGVSIFSLALCFYGITHATTSYFYSTEMSRFANTLIVGEVVFISLYVAVLPMGFGLDGVWFAVVATQMSLAVVSVLLLIVARKRIQQECSKNAEQHKEFSLVEA